MEMNLKNTQQENLSVMLETFSDISNVCFKAADNVSHIHCFYIFIVILAKKLRAF